MSIEQFRAGALKSLRTLLAGLLALGMSAANAAGLPPLPAGLAAPATATRTPAFNLQTAAGGNLRADELRGKVVVARFWASW
ncbi:MAG: hypothetical protein HY017_03445 [Betaproteobacteria bacterium]|nr:hypothetical protein [Betaproteobacteria bacterium]